MIKYRVVSFLVYWIVRLLAVTLRIRVVGEEKVRDLRQTGKGIILVTWHGRTLIPVTRWRQLKYWALISTSRDGEYQNHLFQRFGFQTVRGSSSARGAIQASLAIIKELKQGGTLAFTPDGPRGPIHHVHPGAVFMARKSGSPIIPFGVSAYPRKLARSWDQYLLPFPFARGVLIYGDPIYVPLEAKSEEEQALWSQHVGAAITALEEQAEREVRLRRPDTEREGAGTKQISQNLELGE